MKVFMFHIKKLNIEQ